MNVQESCGRPRGVTSEDLSCSDDVPSDGTKTSKEEAKRRYAHINDGHVPYIVRHSMSIPYTRATILTMHTLLYSISTSMGLYIWTLSSI